MLNQRQIGAYISKLRKEKDMTQGQLADELNVSHQAVSKWERGDSLPDIGTLDELARYFNKTIDQLLSLSPSATSTHMGDFVRHINQNEPEQAAEIVNQNHPDAMTDLAPLIKASALEKVAEKMNPSTFTIEQLVELSPFVGSPILDPLVEGHEDEAHLSIITDLSPFISHNVLLQLMSKINEETLTFQQICDLAPFLGKDTAAYFEQTDLSDVNWREISDLAPFIGSPGIIKLLDTQSKPISLEKIIDIAPFLGREIDSFVEASEEKSEISWKTIEGLAPFISRPVLGKLLKRVDPDEVNLRKLIGLAPFLSREDIEMYLLKAEENLTPEAIVELAPFVGKDTMTKLLAAQLK